MKNNIKYRPDIDGLRALAVISVIIFHFNSKWLPGGFLGVDVFFVISGYLITSIIARQIEENRFTFKEFYTRRIKRILPLFFTVLLITIFIAALLFDTRDYEGFWRSAKYAMQFRANRAFSGQNYFDPVSEEKPLLHLWSLAIEEQFYFIWPLVFLGIYQLIKSKQNPLKWAFWITVLGIILSLIHTEYRLATQPSKTYFELSARAAELLVGCALALFPYSLNQKCKQLLGILSIILLLLCFLFFSAKVRFPGITAMIPTIAAALFIFDSNVNAPYKRLFTLPFIRLIGLWSFSLYLWHWPVLAFMRYILNDTMLPISWMLVAVSLILFLSICTYYLVENPVRRLSLKFIPSFLLIYASSALIIIGVHQVSIMPLISKKLHLDAGPELTQWAEHQQLCMDSDITEQCYVGDLTSQKRVLVIGDSHAGHLASFMDVVGQHEKFKAHMIASGGCGFPPSKVLIKVSESRSNNTCLIINEYLLNHFTDYDAVIISQYLAPKLEDPSEIEHHYLEKFKETLRKISLDQSVYLISDTPSLTIPSIARYLKLQKLGLEGYMQHKHQYSDINANNQLMDITKELKNVYFVDINPFIPKSGILDEKPMYFDDNHLNLYGSKKIGEQFIKQQSLLKP